MSSLRFGTDGVRAEAFTQLTEAFTRALGNAAAAVLPAETFAIGRDTRESGPRLEAALASGFVDGGAEAISLGVVPTPAVARYCADHDVAGAVISASHNPYQDNGIKLFLPGGLKLRDAIQDEIQALLDEVDFDNAAESQSEISADLNHDDRAATDYIDAVCSSIGGRRLDGLSVVIDCANGANSEIAPTALTALGADVAVLHASPDGTNINRDCGSTHPASLQREVVERGADCGVAFDGDADRALLVAGDGRLIDGDNIMAICAADRRTSGSLVDDTVVVTVMTNLGFRLGMNELGIHVHETGVGDRYVLEALEEHGWSLGGEQSGHVIYRELATTGDGLLTAVQTLDATLRDGRPLGELSDSLMRRLPQVLENVAVSGNAAEVVGAIADDIEAASAELGRDGRVLVRPSGTEPLVRVMAEATTEAAAQRVVDQLCASVRRVSASSST